MSNPREKHEPVFLHSGQGAGDDFRDIQNLQPLGQVLRLEGVFEHLGALGAGDRDDLSACVQGLPNPDAARAVLAAAQNVRKEIAAPAAAAKSIRPVLMHFNELDAGNGFQNLPRRVIDSIVPAEVAGIMKGDVGLVGRQGNPLGLDQGSEDLGVMDYL
jgi:hypothetical protein